VTRRLPRSARPRRAERGQATVEFALVSLVLMLLVLGIFQVGIAWFDRLQLEEAVRDGARTAAISRRLPPAQIITSATTAARHAATSLNQGKLLVDVTPSDNPDTGAANGKLWEQGDVVTVRARYPWSVNLLGLVVASGTLDVSTSMRIE
jgi:Flp pilus assembly protein TadG